jgi:hypothetical protein
MYNHRVIAAETLLEPVDELRRLSGISRGEQRPTLGEVAWPITIIQIERLFAAFDGALKVTRAVVYIRGSVNVCGHERIDLPCAV